MSEKLDATAAEAPEPVDECALNGIAPVVGAPGDRQNAPRVCSAESLDDQIRVVVGNQSTRDQVIGLRLESVLRQDARIRRRFDVCAVGDIGRVNPKA